MSYGWLVGIRFLAEKDFSLLHRAQTGSRAQPASYSISISTLSSEVKWPEREVEHLPSPSTEVKNGEIYVFMT
jgi:hypothetical protein